MKLVDLTITDLKALLDYLSSLQEMFIRQNNGKEAESIDDKILQIKLELNNRIQNINFSIF